MIALLLALGAIHTDASEVLSDVPPPLVWDELATLPDGIGYGGPFVATLKGPEGEVLLVAGGANFPEAPPWEGGGKVWHASTWLFDGEEWTVGPPLPAPRAYGAVVPVGGDAWLIGGGDAEASTAEVLVASIGADGALAFAPGPSLPEPSQFLSAGLVGRDVVVLGAQRSADATDLVSATWVFDLDDPAAGWGIAAEFPGTARLKRVTATQKNSAGKDALFVFSGENEDAEIVTVDAGLRVQVVSDELWSYVPSTDAWSRHAPASSLWPAAPGTVDVPRGGSAGVAWPAGQGHVLFLSGVGGVPLDVPQAERDEFPGHVRAYHPVTDTWIDVADEMPRGVVTTGITRWRDGFVIASGEVRPGMRTNQVQFGRVVRPPAELATIDHAVMVLYLAALVGLGVFFSRRERTADDFFLAGRRIPWWAAGLSIYATQLSAITYVAIPAKAFLEDWVFALTSFTILAMAPIVVVFYLPFYRRLGLRTAYEYLERRFALPIRLFGSASFMAFQVARMAIVVFLPSLALSAVTGVDVYLCIGTIGLLATAYTVLGGMEAVVWTDVLQVFVLLGGLFVALFLAVQGAGGLDAALEVAREKQKLRWFAPGTSWTDTASWSVLLGAMFLQFGPYTTDQAVVQRYLSTRDERSAARGVLLNGLVAVPFTFCFFALGSALFAFFSAHPASLAVGMKNDEVLPLFVALEMPAGLAGLVLAGIFAASMSSLDSSMHAIATAWTNDWHERLGIGRASGLVTGRRVTLLMGVVGTGAAALMAAADLRSLYDTFQSVLGLLISPLAGIFVLGVFTRRASAFGVGVGALVAIALLAYVQNRTSLNFMLYGAVGTSTCIVVGYLASLARPPKRSLDGLTWWTRTAAAG
ncbi:MAG: sodium/solute symporter [Planctomycetota bacterium]